MHYGATLDRLAANPLLQDYPHGQPSNFYTELENLDLVAAVDRPIVDPAAARACQAGLWLLHHYLDESHTISQSLPTPEGSWWHAIMHRLEGDYGNSKYWYRSVGSHPALQALEEQMGPLGSAPGQDIFALVDACRNDGSNPQIVQACRWEWQILFDHCFRAATGQ